MGLNLTASKILWVLLALYICVVFPVMYALTGSFFVTLAPLVIGLPMYYIYLRVFKPFTYGVEKHLVLKSDDPEVGLVAFSQVEEEKDYAVNFCGGFSKSELLATGLLIGLLILTIIPFGLVQAELAVSENSAEPLPFVIFGYNMLGSLAFLLAVVAFVDFFDLIIHSVSNERRAKRESRPFSLLDGVSFSTARRPKQIKAIISVLTYALVLVLTILHSYSEPDVIRTDIYLKKLPECADGYSFLVMSDIHIGPLVGRTELARLVDQANDLQADAIGLVGDIADGTPRTLASFVAPLGDLSAPDGVFYVPGNHAYLHGADGKEWLDYYTTLGVKGLNNSHVRLANSTNCAGFNLAGVDDLYGDRADVKAAMEGIVPTDATVLLAHQPSVSKQSVQVGTIDLQLSGHTHGGQIWPLHLLTLLGNTHFAGLEADQGDLSVYTSLGAFGWGPRTRLFSSNNIDLVTFRSGSPNKDPPLNYTYTFAYLAVPFFLIFILTLLYMGPVRCALRRHRAKINQA